MSTLKVKKLMYNKIGVNSESSSISVLDKDLQALFAAKCFILTFKKKLKFEYILVF